MTSNTASIPGFTKVTHRVWYRPTSSNHHPPDHPRNIVLFAWGDSSPKHVAKYTAGFHALFPHANQIVVFSTILDILHITAARRSRDFQPVVELLCRNLGSSKDDQSKTLIHCMSNSGGTSYASVLHEYLEANGTSLPHRLVVFDSTPGSPYLTWFNLRRWSRAMALGTAPSLPWPFILTQAIWGTFLCLLHGWQWLLRIESPAKVATRTMNDKKYEVTSARRLYLYSKEDELIHWGDIEGQAAVARTAGYEVDATVFTGSGHVSHMRADPEKYWAAIQFAWKKSLGDSSHSIAV